MCKARQGMVNICYTYIHIYTSFCQPERSSAMPDQQRYMYTYMHHISAKSSVASFQASASFPDGDTQAEIHQQPSASEELNVRHVWIHCESALQGSLLKRNSTTWARQDWSSQTSPPKAYLPERSSARSKPNFRLQHSEFDLPERGSAMPDQQRYMYTYMHQTINAYANVPENEAR